MRRINQTTEVVNSGIITNEVNVENVNVNPLFQMTETLFGLQLENLMFVCEEGETLWENKYMLPDSLVYCVNAMDPDECLKKRVETLDSGDYEFTTVSSIYEQTNSGNKSRHHFVNSNFDGNYFNLTILIPVILLTRGDITLSFRLDNRIIREILYLCEDVIEKEKKVVIDSTTIKKVKRGKLYKQLMQDIHTLYGEN